MDENEPVHPLRISKNTPTASPTKTANSLPRPLSEISPAEKRRNSPSWNQATKKMGLNTDSSPFQSSPLDGTTSPRLFWQNRGVNPENNTYGRSGSPSPIRRSSIERLQRASRVKNSQILALEQKQEYDPTRIPQVERPLSKVQGNAYGGTGITGLRSSVDGKSTIHGHHRSESQNNIPLYSPTRTVVPSSSPPNPPLSPSKDQASPTKSSLSSRFKNSYDAESAATSGDERELPSGKALHRYAKSVTFDAAPPQINEYEMATPDLSSVGTNSREGSYESTGEEDYDDPYPIGNDICEDSFDASLEDTDKTPVVGPEEWRHDGMGTERTSNLEDPFEGSPMPEQTPKKAAAGRPQHGRTDSSTSSGDHRPLPPLPGMISPKRSNSASSTSLSGTAERMLGAHRSLPSPPPAMSSKFEIQNIGNGKMSLEERLKLMMLSDDGKTAAEQQRERRMRRATPRDVMGGNVAEQEAHDISVQEEDDDVPEELFSVGEYQLPPRISRESILRRVNGNKNLQGDSDYNFSSPPPGSSPERQNHLDPDFPIPSTEDSIYDESEASVIIRPDEGEDGDDIYDMYHESDLDLEKHDEYDARGGVLQGTDDDAESHYSDDEAIINGPQTMEEENNSTPRCHTPVQEDCPFETAAVSSDTAPRLFEDVKSDSKQDDFSAGLQSYMLPKPKDEVAPRMSMSDAQAFLQRPYTPPEHPLSKPEYDGTGWGEEEYDEGDEPGTPESVIHHPIEEDTPPLESPAIPEREATIKASGSKLKTRPSATPSDLVAMREARRQVSREVPAVPPIPEKHRNRLSREVTTEQLLSVNTDSEDFLERHPSFKNRSLTLDLDLGLSLDQDFERVIEAQKRGYLMRQNTKLVAASDKDGDESRGGTRSVGNSPVKKDRPQSWTVEPWNGQTRRRSVKPKRPPTAGPVPPLPGQESNAEPLHPLAEEDHSADLTHADSGERGRLFAKVMGVKDLDLPIPKNERTWFSLTLDNGVHCVTTAWLELARNAPIGQEFELVVPNDLEFQLTLNVKLEKPLPKKIPQSPTKVSKPKASTFSRVFASPKKRKEMEMRQKEEDERVAQQQRDAQARQMKAHPTAWDLLSPLAAEDGSFARSYVCLKEHEARCYGRPYLVDVAAFNEWATEEASFASSVKSKRGNTGVVRRAPYKIGKLELQLLFVPRPKGSTEDDMPKSMNSCIREMKAAEERLSRNWEGHLSQQGGDCPYWRRRYFKLVGTKLTAYHEATRQPRATINLANAKRLIDDRAALTEKETMGKNGRRRRSAFAEEEEGYMFVEEGFRIRFNNGEVIDFYADTAPDKDGWMKALSDVIGRDSSGSDDELAGSRARGKWCELVLKREDSFRRKTEGRRVHSRTKSAYV